MQDRPDTWSIVNDPDAGSRGEADVPGDLFWWSDSFAFKDDACKLGRVCLLDHVVQELCDPEDKVSSPAVRKDMDELTDDCQ